MLLKFAYEEFITDRKFKNTTAVNIKNYNQLLLPFVDYCVARGGLNVEHLIQSHIKEYLLMCQEKGNKPNTINTKIMRIRAFYNFIVEEKIVQENIAKKVKMQRTDVKIDVFTDEHIRQMLAYYRGLRRKEQSCFSYRGYFLIITLLSTGIRRKEAIMLKWSDVHPDIYNETKDMDITIVYGTSPGENTEKIKVGKMDYKS